MEGSREQRMTSRGQTRLRHQRFKGTHARDSPLRILNKSHKPSDTTSLIPPILAPERLHPKNFVVRLK